ncbi:hypothetical protein P171DRAFT_468511 [Karstenula rhodostoma CBS 690.94]|uniref:Uncharacterized protein n=1 Tax=Karstenula rhodostoma CBS 690.94 TaxID=1392251 RepID=A0A9P4UIW6_9PLEO|nr:hypothetical protein P171DRAFT_468511 [Karstenula rhodostoma CBS 690.94]
MAEMAEMAGTDPWTAQLHGEARSLPLHPKSTISPRSRMNWTGGRLQRSKDANKGIIQKQKAHFARARTQLQHDSRASTSTFPYAFLGDERASQQPQFPLTSARTARFTGRSRDRSAAASPVHHDRPGTRNVAERRPPHGHDQANAAWSGNTSGRHHQDRSPDADDSEESLLEAKRRLLRQNDWAGLARPTPPVMNSRAQQGRDEIGNRRKPSHRNALTKREAPSRHVPLSHQTDSRRQLGGGAHQNHDIKIRIGDDALTNRTTVQHSSQAQAQESVAVYDATSEDMTLGNDALHRAALKPGQQVDPNACWFVGAPTHAHRNSMRMATPQSQQPYSLDGSVASMRAGRNEGSNASPNDWSIINSSAEDNASSNKKGEVSNYCIEDIARSSRLTFDTAAEFSAVAPIKNASTCNLIGESNHDHCTANATVTESGNVQMEAGAAGRAESRLPRSIDEGPWMAFLPVQASSSSLSVADDPSALNRAPDRPSPNPPSDSALWSQRVTQGTRTLSNVSLCVSSSLPSIARKSDKNELRERLHMGTRRSGRPKKQRDENDKFWQRLVFGSDEVDSADGILETATSPDKAGMDERMILPSVAVSRGSTPCDPLCGLGFA